ncbi:hypothetical protein CYLTODRAFT_451575 [Cylindrobasidium torrendii FP15055 ss-10]|uniref:Uncharacterized protein n=1 Tax=Cylindrobasidium torrendii FP15055 ss-10 TaxID=1314674 RepID=A0A0D7BJ00_9AGAR|nr:hypothetical protein CYLTODRAFT_451575 [Cylindrobasidium torrendii FP15055 ss-10]
MSTPCSGYKGKVSVRRRGWALLPTELLQYIATLSIHTLNSRRDYGSAYSHHWLERAIYFVVRDAAEMERIMSVCLSWRTALETHAFWHHAISTIDPYDYLATYLFPRPSLSSGRSASAKPASLPPGQYFRKMMGLTCLPCRILYPYHTTGFTTIKHWCNLQPRFGMIGVCGHHAENQFCHVCLRSGNSQNFLTNSSDYQSFPAARMVCRSCRTTTRPWKEYQFDEESKRAITSYIDWGEGSAQKTVEYCLDRAWLKKHTRVAEHVELAKATYEAERADRVIYDSDDEMLPDSDEDDEEEELERIESLAQDSAVNAWARNRILCGLWLLPSDQWISPMHPIEMARSHPFSTVADTGAPPRLDNFEAPPSWPMVQSANREFRRELCNVLLPPLTNIMRRLVMQGASTKDVERTTLDELAVMLREEGTWWDGWNWTRRPPVSEDGSEDSAPSTTATPESPVLSTSTLQTTPSPPPTKSKGGDLTVEIASSPVAAPRQILVAPVLEHPRQIRDVPFLPDDITSLPAESRSAIMKVWRQACSPLYACECNVCERTRAEHTAAQEPEQHNTIKLVPSQPETEYEDFLKSDGHDADAETDIDLEDEEDEDFRTESSDGFERLPEEFKSAVDVRRRKRSIEEIDDADADVEEMDAVRARSRSPPKRRREGSAEPEPTWAPTKVVPASPGRKRSSAEVESLEVSDLKRAKRGIVTNIDKSADT